MEREVQSVADHLFGLKESVESLVTRLVQKEGEQRPESAPSASEEEVRFSDSELSEGKEPVTARVPAERQMAP